jgi:uncharacterized protein
MLPGVLSFSLHLYLSRQTLKDSSKGSYNIESLILGLKTFEMDHPTLHRIEIFPIKSLEGVTLDQVSVLPSGALKGDRQYAIFDNQGRFVNGKSTPLIHKLRSTFSIDLSTVTVRVAETDQPETFTLSEPRTDLESWLSEYFGQAVTVQENTMNGFPDDLNAPGPTIISTETLEAVAQWFPDLKIAELRRRFRTNLEIAGTVPFWEDCLFGTAPEGVKFRVGNIDLVGINPCQRCIVPTRDSWNGEAYPSFQQKFVQNRRESLTTWTEISRFNHFYKLAVNTRIADNALCASLHIGDRVSQSLQPC